MTVMTTHPAAPEATTERTYPDPLVVHRIHRGELDRTAVAVVDRSLELSGGPGYLASNPLARAWRDVRAGAFMHPYGANRGYGIIAAVELGWNRSSGDVAVRRRRSAG